MCASHGTEGINKNMTASTPVNWRAEAEQALEAKRYSQAHALCLQELKLNHSNAHAYYLLSVLAAEHDNYAKAADVVERALRFDSGNAKYHAHLGKCLSAINRLEQASESARHAATLKPKDALTLDTIGVVLSRAGYHDEALAYYQRATSIRPRVASFQYNLGSALQFLGDFDGAETAYTRSVELQSDFYRAHYKLGSTLQFKGNFNAAEAAYKQTLKLQPDFYKAHSSLSQLREKTALDNNLDTLRSLFDGVLGDSAARLHLGHAIAKELEDLGDYDASLDWLRRAKADMLTEISYCPDKDEQLIRAAMETSCEPDPGGGYPSTEPIFIVGMPRSGTTLVDRIVSSHPSIFPAGELSQFSRALRAQSNSNAKRVIDAETLRASVHFDMRSVGKNYLLSTRPRTGNTLRFTDKMPLNFLCCGAILRALPNARIICLRRHPIDTIMSNYRQLFATDFSYYDYSYSLESTADYYVLFDQLVNHWQARLPANRFIQVYYENVVEDLAGEARRLIDFIGLPWDERCLAFHRNPAAVATASAVQVRTPLYSSSIGRWKRYGSALDDVKAILDLRGIQYA